MGWLTAIKGLTLTNALVVVMLALALVPVYLIYRAVNDEKLLDRFLSTYEEIPGDHDGCSLRHVQARGGPELWSIATGFAFQGQDRWQLSVIIPRQPDIEDINTYCASLKLIADSLVQGSSDRVSR